MDKNVKHYPLAQNVEMPQHCARPLLSSVSAL